ncbi:MAG: HAMP domain-containing sensor histidine kinase [Paracoccaceae bacterium]
MFVVAIIVSIGLSLVLASTIANPLSDLAAAAQPGATRTPARFPQPRTHSRPDRAPRRDRTAFGRDAAWSRRFTRTEANEQFAADVAHEIKNPLASLRLPSVRCAWPSARISDADVIDHDVRRLDRLVSDISNASRLDSELVKEEEEPFNLLKMLSNLSDFLGQDARSKGVEFIADLLARTDHHHRLEARLAQVFVNLITNAISFCTEGDAVRIWARQREGRVLVVVEDTAGHPRPGADQSSSARSERPRPVRRTFRPWPCDLQADHRGAWRRDLAENIRPTDADITPEPLGACFVVGSLRDGHAVRSHPCVDRRPAAAGGDDPRPSGFASALALELMAFGCSLAAYDRTLLRRARACFMRKRQRATQRADRNPGGAGIFAAEAAAASRSHSPSILRRRRANAFPRAMCAPILAFPSLAFTGSRERIFQRPSCIC